MVNVTADMVRDRLNLTADDVGDERVAAMIEDATATIELETGLSIDYTNCSEAEAAAIKNLAAIYCLVHISGGAASGLSYKIGSLSVSESMSSLRGKAEALYKELERLINRLRKPYVGRV